MSRSSARSLLAVLASLAGYALLVPWVGQYLTAEYRRVSIEHPLSYKVLKAISLDQRMIVGQFKVAKVVTYYGGRSPEVSQKFGRDDYFLMFRNLDAAIRLDPYNIDAYYFAQAALTWEVKEYAAANALLEFGMKYRTWDYLLPFFAAFNYSYFLKDHANAAVCYRRAAEISGSDLFMRLASRSYYESGRTEDAIAYLKVLISSSKNEALKQMLVKRLKALTGVRIIEEARDLYRNRFGSPPQSVEQLKGSGVLRRLPVDPYGGAFFIDAEGQVRSTSSFSEGGNRK